MKYTYAYKTSDGVRHEDSMNASSREEVFEALRAKGIKAIKVVAADGSKANGEVRGVRKRVVVVLVALATVCADVIAYIGGERTGANVVPDPAVSSPRHQIYGDPAIMEGLERGNFSDVLPRDGDRLLAIFAQPGKLMCAKGANPRHLDEITAILFADYAKSVEQAYRVWQSVRRSMEMAAAKTGEKVPDETASEWVKYASSKMLSDEKALLEEAKRLEERFSTYRADLEEFINGKEKYLAACPKGSSVSSFRRSGSPPASLKNSPGAQP